MSEVLYRCIKTVNMLDGSGFPSGELAYLEGKNYYFISDNRLGFYNHDEFNELHHWSDLDEFKEHFTKVSELQEPVKINEPDVIIFTHCL